MALWLLTSAAAVMAQTPVDLFWKGTVSTDMLNAANWRNAQNQVPSDLSPIFLLNNNLIFTGTQSRDCVFAPPKGAVLFEGIPLYDFTNTPLIVNKIDIRSDFRVTASPNRPGRVTIRATEQERVLTSPANQNPKNNRDFASMIMQELIIAGGIFEIRNTSFNSIAASQQSEVSSIAQVSVNGPAFMSGGTLELRHTASALEQALASLVINDRRNNQGQRVVGKEGNWNWSGGTIDFISTEVVGDRRATLQVERDWIQSGATTIGQAEGVVSLINTDLPQSINATGTADGIARFPALQIVKQSVSLAAGRRINCKGAFHEAGEANTASLLVNGTLTLQGSASDEGAVPAVNMVGGLTIGPDAGSGLFVGDRRKIYGNSGTFTLLNGTVNLAGVNSEVDIRGPFVLRRSTLTAPATMTVNGPGARLKLGGWDVVDDNFQTFFTATFGSANTLSLTGGSPTLFSTTGRANITWPEIVEWGGDLVPGGLAGVLIADWRTGLLSSNFKRVRILASNNPLVARNAAQKIFVQRLEILANGRLSERDGASVEVSAQSISNAGFVTISNNGRHVGPNSTLVGANGGGTPVSAFSLGDSVRAIVVDSDKNLNGTTTDLLIGVLGGITTGLVKIEVFSDGALAETEVLDQAAGVRAMIETGNQTFTFSNPGGLPLTERVDNNSVSNNNELKALVGDTIRITYTDPNGDALQVDIPVGGAGGDNTLKAPDLIIEDFQLQQVNQTVTFTTTIRNIGTAPSNPAAVGFYRDRASAPINGDTPDFTGLIPRIPPFLAVDTLNLVTQNDDTNVVVPFRARTAAQAPGKASVLVNPGASDAAVVLPSKFLPIKATQISSVQTGLLLQSNNSAASMTPFNSGPLVHGLNGGGASDGGLITSTPSSVAALTEGTNALQVVYSSIQTVAAVDGRVNATGPLALNRAYTVNEINRTPAFILMDVRGDTALGSSTRFRVEVRLRDADGTSVFGVSAQSDSAFMNSASTNTLLIGPLVATGSSGTDTIQAITQATIGLQALGGPAYTGTVVYDNMRFVIPPSLIFDHVVSGLPLAAYFPNPRTGANTLLAYSAQPNAANLRLRITAGSSSVPFVLAASKITPVFTGGLGAKTINIPALNVSAGTDRFLWMAANGATFEGNSVQAIPNFTTRVSGNAPVAPSISLQTASGSPILTISGNDGVSNVIVSNNPGSRQAGRIYIDAGSNGQDFALGSVDLFVRDELGNDARILLPSLTQTTGTQRQLWISRNGSTWFGTLGTTTPVFNSLARGSAPNQSVISFAATAGTRYFFAIDGKRTGATLDTVASGNVAFNWSQTNPATNPPDSVGFPADVPGAPGNDSITTFYYINTASGIIPFNNIEATKQAAEPNHGGNTGGRSIWIGWDAPSSGTFFFDTLASDVDTLLAVYTAPQPVVVVQKVVNGYPPGSNLNAWALADSDQKNNELTGETNNAAGPINYNVPTPPNAGPDLVIDSLEVVRNLDTGTLTFTSVVRNAGNALAGSAFMTLYYNRATPPARLDPANQAKQFPALSPGDTATVVFTLNNPGPGDYTSFTYADSGDFVAETSESNNVSQGFSFNVPIPPDAKPDLRVISFAAVVDGTTVTYQLQADNIGIVPVGATTARVFFNRPNAPTSADAPDATIAVGGLAVNAVTPILSFVRNNVDPGSYNAWVLLDGANVVAETDELNNVGTSGLYAVTGLGNLADLTISNITVFPNEPYTTFVVTVNNQGAVTSPATKLALFYNRNSAPASGAGANAVLAVPSLGSDQVGSATQVEFSVKNLPSGNFQAWAFVDPENNVVESNGNNNALGGGFYELPNPVTTVQSDLFIESFAVSALSATSFQFTASVKNKGAAPSSECVLGFYPDLLSRPITGLDRPETFNVPVLLPNARKLFNWTRSGVLPGGYRAWLFVDADGEVSESNELNNSGGSGGSAGSTGLPYNVAVPANGPDLEVLSYTWAVNGTQVVRTANVKNNGNQATGAGWRMSFYNDRNTPPTQKLNGQTGSPEDDFILGPNINPGVTQVINAPAITLQGGFYRPFVYVDSLNTLVETREGNNVEALTTGGGQAEVIGSTEPRPDLIVTDFSIFVNSRDAIYTATVRNDGTEASFPTTLSVFFFLQDAPTLQNERDFTVQVPGLQPAEEVQIQFRLNTLPYGTYRSWAYVDPFGTVPETNESNNTSTVALNYTIPQFGEAVPDLPDLFVTDFVITNATNGFTFNFKVKNQDVLASTPCTLELRLNPVAPLPALSPEANRRRMDVPGLLPDATWTRNGFRVELPAGSYALVAEIDILGAVQESNEVNNQRGVTDNQTDSAPVRTVSVDLGVFEVLPEDETTSARNNSGGTSGPDLVIDLLYADPLGTGVEINGFVRNAGTQAAAASKLAIFLNRDTAPANGIGADVVVDVPALEPDESVFLQLAASELPVGTFTLFGFIDSESTVAEKNENNNASAGEAYTTFEPASGFNVSVGSSPIFGVPILVKSTDPNLEGLVQRDQRGLGNGSTSFQRFYNPAIQSVILTAPATDQGRNFLRWVDVGTAQQISTDATITLPIADGTSVRAEFDGPAASAPPNGVITY